MEEEDKRQRRWKRLPDEAVKKLREKEKERWKNNIHKSHNLNTSRSHYMYRCVSVRTVATPCLNEVHGSEPDKVLMPRQLSNEGLNGRFLTGSIHFSGCLCSLLIFSDVETVAEFSTETNHCTKLIFEVTYACMQIASVEISSDN